jgi:hypothetical protein
LAAYRMATAPHASCPSGTPDGVWCIQHVGTADVPGLGRVAESYTNTAGDSSVCPPERPVVQFRAAVLEIAGRGRIDLSVAGPVCGTRSPTPVGPLYATVTGGSGRYAGASGSLVFNSYVSPTDTSRDTWSGSLTVPGLDFDLARPVLAGAVAKTVRAPREARRVRVRYAVTARDAVDGVVPVACAPRSGSRFRRGRTVVQCSATDSSANTATKRFVVTVRPSR